MNSALIVKNSRLNGQGVFALQPIRRGDVAVAWDNTKQITAEELQRLSPEERNYIDIQKDKILLIGKPERFVNHSCEPNTSPGDRCDIATRDIPSGEEITTDYSQFYIPGGPFQCTCGSPQCRGLIRGTNS